MLTGACVSRAGLNRKTALATLTLTLAFEAPDIDSVTYIWGPITGLEHHRGITHSLIGAPFLAASRGRACLRDPSLEKLTAEERG